MSKLQFLKTFLMAVGIWILSLCFISTIALAGPGGGHGDGQEPWPLAFGSLNQFKKSELIGIWKVEKTNWYLSIKNVKNQNKILMAQLWDDESAESIFNGPLRLEPLWVEGVGVMNSLEFYSIYMFRTKTGFKMKIINGTHSQEYNLQRTRMQ